MIWGNWPNGILFSRSRTPNKRKTNPDAKRKVVVRTLDNAFMNALSPFVGTDTTGKGGGIGVTAVSGVGFVFASANFSSL
jgi:hypothetical protein